MRYTYKRENRKRWVSIKNDLFEITVSENDGTYRITYAPALFGDIRLTVQADEVCTFAAFYRSETPEALIEKRLHFIAEKQQYKRRESALYGAYLIFDNRMGYPVFNAVTRDHNACRERVGMALLMCLYLQKKKDPLLQKSLNLFIDFAKREFFDEETGEVFDGTGKNRKSFGCITRRG